MIGFDAREPARAAGGLAVFGNGDAARHARRTSIHKNLSILSRISDHAVARSSCRSRRRPSPDTDAAIDAAGGPRRYIVLNPGAAWPNKRWPPIALARWPRRCSAVPACGRSSHGGLRSASSPTTIVARLRRRGTAAPADIGFRPRVLMREAALVVSGDTGPLHIAAAMGTPLVGLYGPTWPERNGPWDPDDVVISRAERVRVPSQAPVPARRAVHQRDHARRSGRAPAERRLAQGSARSW